MAFLTGDVLVVRRHPISRPEQGRKNTKCSVICVILARLCDHELPPLIVASVDLQVFFNLGKELLGYTGSCFAYFGFVW
jgi:hypothetical protein